MKYFCYFHNLFIYIIKTFQQDFKKIMQLNIHNINYSKTI